jgi:hypothetical protein
MNQDIKREWVAKLRSGKYEQGKGRLRSEGNQYCCLGVLCEIGVEDGTIEPPILTDEGYLYNRNSAFLPSALIEEYGLRGQETVTLMGMNDEKNMSFSHIAQYIEQNL